MNNKALDIRLKVLGENHTLVATVLFFFLYNIKNNHIILVV